MDSRRWIFGRSYAAEPDRLVEELKADEAIAEADTLLLTVPNQLGVDYNAHVIAALPKHAAPPRAEPTRRRLQCPWDRGHPEALRSGSGLAMTSGPEIRRCN